MAVYSHSQISSFENCPQQYKFKYLDRVPAGPPSIESFLGNKVHEALEELYRQRLFERTLTLEQLVSYYEYIWKRDWVESTILVRPDIEAWQFRAAGVRHLTDYYQNEFANARGRTLGLEQHVRVTLGESGDYALQGYIDRLTEVEPGVLEVHDYKTSGHLPAQQDLDADRQLALYEIALRRMWPDTREVRLVWHYLAFGRRMESARTQEQRDELATRTRASIDALRSERDFAPRESALCDWCDYQRICPAKSHRFIAAEAAIGELFRDRAVTLADRYFELSEQRATLDTEMEEIKAKLLAYVERSRLTNVYGERSRIAVRTYTNYVEPSERDDPDRYRAWMEFLKARGLWDAVARPHFVKLSQLVGRITDADMKREIDSYLRTVKVHKLYASRRRG